MIINHARQPPTDWPEQEMAFPLVRNRSATSRQCAGVLLRPIVPLQPIVLLRPMAPQIYLLLGITGVDAVEKALSAPENGQQIERLLIDCPVRILDSNI